MRALNIVIRAVAVAAAVYLSVVLCWRPYQCNRASVRLMEAARAAVGGDPGARMFLRDHVDEALDCLESDHSNTDMAIVVGTAYSLSERYADALTNYETLLRYQRRPEIYFNIGVLENKLGRREEAIQSLLTAYRFNPELLNGLTDRPLQLEVVRRAAR